MKIYYIIEDNEKQGPFSIEELKTKRVFPKTPVWEKSFDGWKEAGFVPELADILEKEPPEYIPSKKEPIPTAIQKENSDNDLDYSKVEDIAKVNYKYAIIITVVYILLRLFARQFTLSITGIIISTILVVTIWFYFRKYFDGVRDKSTSKWTNLMMGAYGLLALVNLFALSVEWRSTSIMALVEEIIFKDGDSAQELVTAISIIEIGLLVTFALIFITGIRIIIANKNHKFSLKRIAFSAMIFIPISMSVDLIQSIGLNEALIFKEDLDMFSTAIFLLPYYFLLYHFYRAETEDATK
ncbi:MAG TPA: DUF4339 domain-containing protein [Bacteroidetes bacterium]|nr:DUF4339 domain-containing protein [Bacteroidota bacterium]